MAIDASLLDILVCPADKRSKLAPASDAELTALNGRILGGKVQNVGGKTVEKPLQGGLVRADRALLYPIIDDIPVLLIDEAVPLS